MKNRFRTKSLRMLTVTLIILVAFSGISRIFGINIISSLLGYITTGMQRVSAEVTKSESKKSYEELLAENESLRSEVGRLRTELADYNDIKEENLRLWKYFEIKKADNKYRFVPINVIRRDARDDFYSFTADRGSSDGVSMNDPVITQNGLVGYVSGLSSSYCTVTTLLSPDLLAGVKGISSKVGGVISGNAHYCDKNLTTMTKISFADKLKIGEQISTTGIGGMYPENVSVGTVKSIVYDSYDGSPTALIEPYEDVRNLTAAAIVTDFGNKGKIKGSEDSK